jgi:anti-sigma regulatory factor (Ser/Thr protein kinase)
MSTYLRIPLASEPASVRRAREAVRSWLVDVGRSNTEYVAAQIVTELTTNAIVHAHGPVVLHLWCRRDGVRIGVSDGSTDVPALTPEDPAAASGRGLRLVDQLASRWESEAHERGKITWAEITQEPAVGGRVPAPDEDGSGRPARWHLGWRGEGSRRTTTADR